MNPFEEELRQALARREPPAGFAGRVLERAGRQRRAHRWMRPVLAAAACLAIAAAGLGYREYRGIQARNQVLLALRITAREWNKAEQRLRETVNSPQIKDDR